VRKEEEEERRRRLGESEKEEGREPSSIHSQQHACTAKPLQAGWASMHQPRCTTQPPTLSPPR